MGMVHVLRALLLTCLFAFAAGTTVGPAAAASMTMAMTGPMAHDMSGCKMSGCTDNSASKMAMKSCDLLCSSVVAGVVPQAVTIEISQSEWALDPFPMIRILDNRSPGLDLPPPRSLVLI